MAAGALLSLVYVVFVVGWDAPDRSCEVVRAATFCAEWDGGEEVAVFDAGGLAPGSAVVVAASGPAGEVVLTASAAGTLAGDTAAIGGPDARYELRGTHRDGTPVTVAVDLR